MILFKEDWSSYPGAQPDYSTPNRAWVKLCGVLYKMGVENCLFPLALHNPALKGVDPFSDNLTIDEITMITIECKENPWYALREIIKIPPVAGPNPVAVRANRANISLWWLFFNHITTLLIQPRQTGKSVSTDGLMITLFAIATVNTDIHLLSKDDDLRVKNIGRIKEMIELLPFYLQLRTRQDSWNTEKLSLDEIGNAYRTSVPQASEVAAMNLGRGMTIAINHIDEFAFIKNLGITLPELLAAATAARDEAKACGAPYGNIYTTTAGYLNTKHGAFAYETYQECFLWTEKLFDCKNEADLVASILKNSKSRAPQVLLEYNHRQLGFTDEWMQERIDSAKGSKETIGSNFLNIWGAGSASSPIKKELLKVIRDSLVKDPIIRTTDFGYIIRWYVREVEIDQNLRTRKLIAAIDTSDAIGKDDIGICIRDAATGEVVGSGVYNETNLFTFAEWLLDLLLTFPNLTMLIERRSSGVMILDTLIKLLVANGEDPFRRLFNWVTNEYRIKPKYFEEVINVPFEKRASIVYDKYKEFFGFGTSGGGKTSRSMLYGDVFNTSIKYTGKDCRDATLIDQLSTLTVRNGRIDHKAGGHDDMVIGWLLSYWFLQKAENKSFYGFEAHNVLSAVTEAIIDEQGGQEAIDSREYQLELKSYIDSLVDKLKGESNPIKSRMMTQKIRHLYREIDTSLIKSFNIETILENIELDKKKKKSYWNK